MKKLVLFLSVCALLASAVWVGAAGDAGDPLASLSYLNGEFSQRAEKKIDQALEQSDKELAERLKNGEVGEATATWQETRLKEGDTLHGVTGTGVLLLAGRGRVTYKSGAVVDVTTGAVVPSGTNLTANHRYLTAEDTTAAYTVTSETAVVDYQGQYAFSYSDRPDYNAMAAALKSLHLFKGTFTGYGEGFDLEAAPTRLQALIMFIRVLGEEEQALAWSGTTPFKDIEKGSQAEHYVLRLRKGLYERLHSHILQACWGCQRLSVHRIRAPGHGIQLRCQQGSVRYPAPSRERRCPDRR